MQVVLAHLFKREPDKKVCLKLLIMGTLFFYPFKKRLFHCFHIFTFCPSLIRQRHLPPQVLIYHFQEYCSNSKKTKKKKPHSPLFLSHLFFIRHLHHDLHRCFVWKKKFVSILGTHRANFHWLSKAQRKLYWNCIRCEKRFFPQMAPLYFSTQRFDDSFFKHRDLLSFTRRLRTSISLSAENVG